MAKNKVLVIEDEENIQELIAYNLDKEGWDVLCRDTGEGGLTAARAEMPDVILLDIMLPEMDGLSVCRELKKDPHTATLPIIMLTARGEEADIVVGLEMGADDYVTKPFSPRVLVARIRALLRRRANASKAQDEGILEAGGMSINPGRREVLVDGESIALTETEFRLLHYLARRPGWVFTRNQILDAVRGEDAIVTDRAVDVQVVGLRRKLGDAGMSIETVRGVGYRFREE